MWDELVSAVWNGILSGAWAFSAIVGFLAICLIVGFVYTLGGLLWRAMKVLWKTLK